ncbi:MAG: SDR family NAD(P)-dependent oxidoreductase [Thermoanaerobaculia bacterium]|nr:SDR family NAD(P)-dependent oxidoreductase [Thermoanaerobaculia bacterium]
MSPETQAGRASSHPNRRGCALVTGGGVRIGRSIALALADKGFPVAIHHHRSVAGASETATAIRTSGGDARLFQADLSDPDQCRNLAREVEEWTGSVEVLVNSAGVFLDNEANLSVEESWRVQSAVNLLAPYILSLAFAKALPEDRTGTIINVLDARLERPAGDHLLYRLTKAALAHFNQCLAQTLAPRVRVNAVAPGALLPPPGESDDELRDRLRGKVPLGLPENRSVTRTIHYLLDEQFLTGQIINLDGGQYT